MDNKPEILWALFDKGEYKGGRVLHEGQTPTDVGENPEGYEEVIVERFPAAHETWDSKHKAWVGNDSARERIEHISHLRTCSREEFAEILMGDMQRCTLHALKELGIEITEEQVARLFPLAGQEGG